ncbi:MAG: DUF6049 family protein [Mycobacteriales bacterium]
MNLRRTVAAVAAAGFLLVGLPVAAPAASQVAAAPGDPLPVAVTLAGLEPRDLRPDSELRVTALLHNTGADGTGPVSVRLHRGLVMDTRGELQAADTDPPPTGTASGRPQVLEGLAPGRSVRVTYQTTVAELGLGTLGVYPVALTVQSRDDGRELGRVQTLLPFFPTGIETAGTRVALLWPLLDRPHRLTGAPAGARSTATTGAEQPPEVFVDDGLARSVGGGRLDQLLAAVEQLPEQVRLTLVVDPETVEALDRMTRGYRVVTGARSEPGRGAAVAAAWLARLRKAAARHLLVAVPYGDPDVVALERGGLGALARLQLPHIEAMARVLGVRPTTEMAWPPDGALTDTALDEAVAQGVGAVVLDPGSLPGGPPVDSGRTPDGASPLPALGGEAVALVPDPVVQRLLDSGGLERGTTGGPRLAEQRLLAELAMITAEAPSDGRTLVLAPARRWEPPLGYARALAADLGRLPWLAPVDALQAAAGTVPVDRGPLAYPVAARKRELPGAQVRQIATVQTMVADFRTALDDDDASAELSPYSDALRRAGSSAWRTDPRAGAAFTLRLRRQISALRARVTMSSPATGDYTLASADSPLLLTLENRLDVPVAVRVRLTTPPGFAVSDIGVVRIPAGDKRSVRVPASVQRTGTFTVRGQLTTPGAGTLGQEITLSVRSTAYGGLALGITGLAFTVLVGAVLVRLARQLRGRPDQAPVAAGSPADRSRP